MCDDGQDTAKRIDEQVVRARKAHRCGACSESIAAGDLYHRDTSVYDDSIYTFKHCIRCWNMVEALFKKGVRSVDYDLNCGEVWESPPDDVAALAFALPRDFEAREPGRTVAE